MIIYLQGIPTKKFQTLEFDPIKKEIRVTKRGQKKEGYRVKLPESMACNSMQDCIMSCNPTDIEKVLDCETELTNEAKKALTRIQENMLVPAQLPLHYNYFEAVWVVMQDADLKHGEGIEINPFKREIYFARYDSPRHRGDLIATLNKCPAKKVIEVARKIEADLVKLSYDPLNQKKIDIVRNLAEAV